MPIPSSVTNNYDAILSTTLNNYRRTMEDNVSTSNALFFLIKNKEEDAYEEVDDIGDRMQIPLMYELGQADSYSGYDQLDTTPMDGVTSAFFDWRQAAVPITISGLEEKKNSGEAKIVSLLETKTKQAELGMQEYFGKGLLQGNGPNTATEITTARTSVLNGSQFIDPLFLLIKYDPTTSTVVGNINQSTSTWWRNQKLVDASSNYAGFLKNLRKLRNDCSKGAGGGPNLHITDQHTYEYYEAALAAAHRNPSYQKADIPFDNIMFYGKPVTWDEFMPDVSGGTTTQSTSSGTWAMINTKFWKIKVHKGTNFANTPFQKPENQDAKVSHILWLGGAGVMNRRKQGVMGSIDTTPTS